MTNRERARLLLDQIGLIERNNPDHPVTVPARRWVAMLADALEAAEQRGYERAKSERGQ